MPCDVSSLQGVYGDVSGGLDSLRSALFFYAQATHGLIVLFLWNLAQECFPIYPYLMTIFLVHMYLAGEPRGRASVSFVHSDRLHVLEEQKGNLCIFLEGLKQFMHAIIVSEQRLADH